MFGQRFLSHMHVFTKRSDVFVWLLLGILDLVGLLQKFDVGIAAIHICML